MTATLPAAPAFTFTAAVSERELRFDRPGVPTLLLCLTQDTQKEAERLEEVVRTRWPSAADVLVAYVIDLRKIPGIFKGLAQGMIEKEYHRSVEILPEGWTGYDYVVILPDWKGEAIKALNVDLSASKGLCIVSLTADGRIAGTLTGATGDEIEALVERTLTA